MNDKKFMLSKQNLWLIAIGFVVVIIGFLLMTGKPTVTDFNPDIYSFRRIVLAPVVCLIGFVFITFAILYKRKSTTEE